jgi:hypothetical protein
MARMKSQDGSGSSTGAHRGGASGGSGKNRGGKQSTGGERKSSAGRDDKCAYCGKKGHWVRECWKKKRDEEAQANVAQGEEEEQSLLLAHDIVINVASALPLHQPPHHAAQSTLKNIRYSPT